MKNLAIVFLSILAVTYPVSSFAKSKIQPAKDYVAIERIREARILLDEAILEDPTNPIVHFDAGLVYKAMGVMNQANQAFRNAYKFDQKYGPKLGLIYETLGFEAVEEGSMSDARESFEYAIRYNCKRKTSITRDLFQQGKEYFDLGNLGKAFHPFSVLVQIDPAYSDRISSLYFDLGAKSNLEMAIDVFHTASHFSPVNNQKIGAKLITLSQQTERFGP